MAYTRTESTIQAYGQQLVVTDENDLALNILPEEETVVRNYVSDSGDVGTVSIAPQQTVVDTTINVRPQSVDSLAEVGSELLVDPDNHVSSEDLAVGAILAAASQGSLDAKRAIAALPSSLTIRSGLTPESVFEELTRNTSADLNFATAKETFTVSVEGSTINTPEQIRTAFNEAQKVDLKVSLRSRKSEVVEFNMVQVPEIEARVVYNFFTGSEEIVSEQEDQSKDPLLKNAPRDVPRYVELTWESAETKNQLLHAGDVSRRNSRLRLDTLARPRGYTGHDSSNFPHSVRKQDKNYNPYFAEGANRSVNEIHTPEKAFDSVVNNKVFPNTLSAVVNVGEQPSVVSDLPYKKISEIE
jgi:hypothetical protein